MEKSFFSCIFGTFEKGPNNPPPFRFPEIPGKKLEKQPGESSKQKPPRFLLGTPVIAFWAHNTNAPLPKPSF